MRTRIILSLVVLSVVSRGALAEDAPPPPAEPAPSSQAPVDVPSGPSVPVPTPTPAPAPTPETQAPVDVPPGPAVPMPTPTPAPDDRDVEVNAEIEEEPVPEPTDAYADVDGPMAQPVVSAADASEGGESIFRRGLGLVVGLRAQLGFAQVFSDLGVAPAVELELGYRLPWLGRRLGIMVTLGYQYSYASGTGADDRLGEADGTPYPEGYSWDLDEHAMTLGLNLFGRIFDDARRFSPYLWAGPRAYFLESVIVGEAGGAPFGQNVEVSTAIGLSAGVGFEFLLGPGAFFVEIELGWSGLDHDVTGDASTGQLGLGFGYRALL